MLQGPQVAAPRESIGQIREWIVAAGSAGIPIEAQLFELTRCRAGDCDTVITTIRPFPASGRYSCFIIIQLGARSFHGSVPIPRSMRFFSGETTESSGLIYGTVIVAMATVGVMKVAVHQIVHVVAMRHGLVPTAGTMLMACLMGTASVIRGAVSRVGAADGQMVLIHVVRVRMMKVAIVQVVGVPVVAHGQVTAALPVDMFVTFVPIAGHQ